MNTFRKMMTLLALALLALPALAHDVAPVTEGNVTEATVNGVHILVKQVPGAELVAANLYIRGGARNWGKDDAGVESLALAVAASGGAGTLDKVAFSRRLSELGSSIGTDTGSDWSMIGSKGLLENFDASFGLLADVFLRPAMPAAEVELARSQALVNLQREEEQPEGRLAVLVNDTLFAGQPYLNRPQGSIATVTSLTLAQLNAHMDKLRDGSRLLLIVVGDLDAAQVISQARGAFGAMPHGHYVDAVLPAPHFDAPRLVTEQRTLPTNYLQGYFAVPAAGAPDDAAARVAMSYMWDQLFKEVRTKRNLSYAPGAGMMVYQAGALGMVSVSAVDPSTTYKVMLDELRRLQDTPLAPDRLAGAKSTYLTGVMFDAEATDEQANLLAVSQFLFGDWRAAGRFPDQVRAVTAADVQAFAKKYFVNVQTLMLGDPSKLDPALGKSL
ncbi:MAG: pitrilysin family protein [Arenimonas sp.]